MDTLVHLLRVRRDGEVVDNEAPEVMKSSGEDEGSGIDLATVAMERSTVAASNSSAEETGGGIGSDIAKHGSEIADKAKDFAIKELRKVPREYSFLVWVLKSGQSEICNRFDYSSINRCI